MGTKNNMFSTSAHPHVQQTAEEGTVISDALTEALATTPSDGTNGSSGWCKSVSWVCIQCSALHICTCGIFFHSQESMDSTSPARLHSRPGSFGFNMQIHGNAVHFHGPEPWKWTNVRWMNECAFHAERETASSSLEISDEKLRKKCHRKTMDTRKKMTDVEN